VAYFAYWTLVGRIDQFVLGILAWQYRRVFTRRPLATAFAIVAFFSFYQWFLSMGGFYGTQGNYAVWIVLPTIEASFFSFLVVYYDTTFTFSRVWYWRALERIGAVSYSIYLLHQFFVFNLADMVGRFVPAMATWEIAEAVALVVFVAFVPVAWISYRYVEMPFLRLRARYTQERLHNFAVFQIVARSLTPRSSGGKSG
jgi:peptidoglycan/LPS O-acetylase OafA/YrhL